jgi:cell filamentation protein, protein adenylyltransferase
VSGTAGPDPYLDPASGVLRNLLGITDPGELARAEAALSASRLIDLERRRLPGGYDLEHLRAFHRYILGDVYDWAGELRTVTIAKGSLFCLPQHLASYAADVFGRLAAADRLRGLNREQFISRVTEFLADINALHPFREGNGRAQRAFFSQLAHDAGHHIDWVRMDPDINVIASTAAHRGDLGPMTSMLSDLIDLPHPPGPPGRGGGHAA